MRVFASFWSFASAVFHRSRVEGKMDEELRAHIEDRANDLERSGVPRAEAERRARLEFGGYQKFKEECREAMSMHFVETLVQDVRYGLRVLRKSPGFTTVAVLTLALGIGANTAIFSLLDALVLRDLAVPHPEELVRFGAHTPGDDYASVSLPMFQEIMRDQNVFSGAFAVEGGPLMNVEANGELTRASVDPVTGSYYSVLGAVPEIGRLIESTDVDLNVAQSARVAVLGHDFWERQYGGARDIIGSTIKI